VSATTPRRVLLVAYYYPPQNIIGARRPAALAKWLRRRGHEVTVLTSVQAGHGPDDAPSRLVRTRDLLATRLNWRGQSLDVVTGNSDAAWGPGANFWGAIFVPDVQLLSWAPFAVEAGLRLQRREPFDVVVTTSPIESAHAVGLALRRRGVPWVADLRDGWRFEAPRDAWPLRAQRALDGGFERVVVRRADRVVTVSEPLSQDLRARHGIEVQTITNGFDPEEEPGAPPEGAIDPGKLTLVHTGGLGHERTLAPLLEALARLAHEDPALAERVELVLAGAQTSDERELYAQPAYAPFVRPLGFVAREQAMALQRAADVLVLATSGVRTGEATGKLFEYLAAGRPILVLGAGSAAGDIVEREGAGIAIPVRDADAAEAALRRALAGELPQPPPSAREAYAYPALAERYEQVLEAAIAQRSRGERSRSAASDPAPTR
jgi:glycosyltransferase involved in cell wall biosynthesis